MPSLTKVPTQAVYSISPFGVEPSSTICCHQPGRLSSEGPASHRDVTVVRQATLTARATRSMPLKAPAQHAQHDSLLPGPVSLQKLEMVRGSILSRKQAKKSHRCDVKASKTLSEKSCVGNFALSPVARSPLVPSIAPLTAADVSSEVASDTSYQELESLYSAAHCRTKAAVSQRNSGVPVSLRAWLAVSSFVAPRRCPSAGSPAGPQQRATHTQTPEASFCCTQPCCHAAVPAAREALPSCPTCREESCRTLFLEEASNGSA